MDLGNHYIALSVKDIRASKEFYEKLGFEADENCGGIASKWMILKHGSYIIGLYQDMLPANVLTFNPPDARAIQRELKNQGINIQNEVDEAGSGPCHFTLIDPDGNAILIDQHF